jgi:Na+-translocating ferredoxin:NAD+ oxidoreductase RnfA subunit
MSLAQVFVIFLGNLCEYLEDNKILYPLKNLTDFLLFCAH